LASRYHAANRACILERKRSHQVTNRAAILESKRVYQEATREARLKYQREYKRRYREDHPDAVVTQAERQYHRDYLREYMQRPGRPCRYASSGCLEFARTGGNTCPAHNRADTARRHRQKLLGMLVAQDWQCTWCGEPMAEDLCAAHIDHIIPAARGGPDVEWNLQALHGQCNITKSDKLTPQAVTLAAEHGIELAPVARLPAPTIFAPAPAASSCAAATRPR
jgi:5-methylcytosine-specific restriction endonuclease McrA